jgi:deazaflavin-dependent oxidoreductase (nitroreductase family)
MQIGLTTTGRRSGEPRRVTLYAWELDEALVVVGSSGGSERDPAWVGNLRAEPRATIRRGKVESPVVATELDGAEHDRAWTVVVERFHHYASFQRRTERRIPLFRLDPAEADRD